MENLRKLAEAAGISSSYIDKTGKEHQTADEVRRFFLQSMGIAAGNEDEISASLQKAEEKPLLPDVLSFYDNETVEFEIAGKGLYTLELLAEDGKCVWRKQTCSGENIRIDGLTIGYYTLKLTGDNCKKESLLIYAPQKCLQPEFLQKHEHLFGVAVMLYALHSGHNMGIGDFSDLAEIVRLTAAEGGDTVGVNPLGVMSPFTQNKGAAQSDVSPYRTLSRLFVNYIYLDLCAEEDFIHSPEVAELEKDNAVTDLISRLNAAEYVNYPEVLRLKLRFLTLMYAYFKSHGSPERLTEFSAYKSDKGKELDNLATFEVLLEKQAPADYWRQWQHGYADIFSAAVKEFRQHEAERIDFYKYCHWLADRQIKNVQKLALSLGMKIGLYTDMPIGAASNGAEVWENPAAFVLNADIGAPADPMRPRGQSWGFTPYHPQKLRELHYAPFIRLVRENMQYSGALRLDHAMGLQRLFWGFFAENNPVVQGAYVYYNIKDMVAIVALESVRNNCLIIGEDLGTVPEGFREYMAEHGLLSYKVFCRQKEKDGSFVKPENYMYLSLAQTSTHDQATACGFWTNEDIEVFNRCGLYVNHQQYTDNLDGRAQDRRNMIKAFAGQNMLSAGQQKELKKDAADGKSAPADIEFLLNQYCAKTGSTLVLVRLNDIFRQQKLDNAPGTVSEYPNWRLKMSVSVAETAASPAFKKMLQLLRTSRP